MNDDFKNPPKKRSTDKAREEALMKGREIWELFRREFVNTRCKPEEIPTRFMVLRDALTHNIKHQEVLDIMLAQVDHALKKAVEAYPAESTPKSRHTAKRTAWSARNRTPKGRRSPPNSGATGATEPGDPSLN